MRTVSKWLAAGAALLALLLVLALWLAVDGAPRVPQRADISPADVERAVALARAQDPRRGLPGRVRFAVISERDADLLLHHAARRWLAVATRVQLQQGRALLQASVAAPFGRWCNIELSLRQTPAGLPEIEQLRVGRLPLPRALALPLLRAVAARHGLQPDALPASDWIRQVRLLRGHMLVSYHFDLGTANQLRAALLAPADLQRLQAYNARLADIAQHAPEPVSLAALLPPLFALAAERSAAGGDAVAENRAALRVLTLFANHRPLGLLVPAADGWPQPRPLRVLLRQREDTPLHFLISAVIAAEAGTPLADAVGLWKELADSRGGSGFSFNDLAADRAGTRFGELAVGDAARLQARLAAGVGEGDFMPAVADLPEAMAEAEFVARFGGVGAPGYRRMLADIERRIEALPLSR